MNLKYIIFDNISAVVFFPGITHKDLRVKFTQPTSAGFVQLSCGDDGKIKAHCFGESISLNLQSKSTDSTLVEMALNM